MFQASNVARPRVCVVPKLAAEHFPRNFAPGSTLPVQRFSGDQNGAGRSRSRGSVRIMASPRRHRRRGHCTAREARSTGRAGTRDDDGAAFVLAAPGVSPLCERPVLCRRIVAGKLTPDTEVRKAGTAMKTQSLRAATVLLLALAAWLRRRPPGKRCPAAPSVRPSRSSPGVSRSRSKSFRPRPRPPNAAKAATARPPA